MADLLGGQFVDSVHVQVITPLDSVHVFDDFDQGMTIVVV